MSKPGQQVLAQLPADRHRVICRPARGSSKFRRPRNSASLRMPVRVARELERGEGLLEKGGARGYGCAPRRATTSSTA